MLSVITLNVVLVNVVSPLNCLNKYIIKQALLTYSDGKAAFPELIEHLSPRWREHEMEGCNPRCQWEKSKEGKNRIGVIKMV